MNRHALVCTCGSLNFERTLVMFPLHWVATCKRCGRPHPVQGTLKLDKAPRSPPVRRVVYPYPDDYGYG